MIFIKGKWEMWKADQLQPIKLIFGGREYITGKENKLKLDSIKPSPGASAILIGIEINQDPDLFQKMVNAAQ